MEKRYVLGEDAKNDFERMRKAPIKVPGGRIGKRFEGDLEDGQRYVRITGHTSIGSNRWRYSGILSGHTGVGEFADNAPAPENTLDEIYNTFEANNDNSGVQGNGVDVGTLPAGFAIKPLATDAVMPVRIAGFYPDWIGIVAAPNAVDGECLA